MRFTAHGGALASPRSPQAASRWRRPVARLRRRWALPLASLAFVGGPAVAQSHDPSAFVQAGEGDRAVRSVAIGATRSFTAVTPDAGPWSLYGEAVLGEWFTHHHDEGQRTSFTQVTAAPVVRYAFGGLLDGAFVELGVGLSLIMPHFEDHGRRFSTVFNFDDHASLGVRFGERRDTELSVRVEHFSNGGIRNPNPGQNLAQLRLARHF